MLYIFSGIISTALVILLEFLFWQIPFSLHDFRPGLVLPAGGLIEGALCSLGIYLYLRIRKRRLKARHFIFGVICAFVGFWVIYYLNYSSAYINNGMINHSFKGMHISNYMYDNTHSFNFGNYLNFIFNHYIVKTYSVGGYIVTTDKLGIGFHRIAFILECIGFCLGSLGCSVIAMEGRDYCKSCKGDFTIKRLYSFDPEILGEEMEGITKSFESKSTFSDFISKDRRHAKEQSPFIEVYLKYCTSCKVAYISFKYMYFKEKANDQYKLKEDKDRFKQIEAPYLIT
ncbi:MAG: hypothetical protein Q8920_13095 [Bacillota bacterium]|nr:hypothetical protein [Bacillota bacterium]